MRTLPIKVMPVRRVAVANQKGGVGKTTTVVNLGAALAELGRRVLIIDLDPQANASTWLGTVDARALYEVFENGAPLEKAVRPTLVDGLDLVPSSSWMTRAERNAATQAGAEMILRQAMDELSPNTWDIVLVDCPPALGLLSYSALTACGEVLVPVQTRVMPLAGLVALTQTIDTIRLRLNRRLHLSAVLPCQVDLRTTLSREVVDALRERFGEVIMESMIRESVRVAEAPGHRLPVTSYAPDSTVAADYRAAALEFDTRGAAAGATTTGQVRADERAQRA
jgi:chromosome partitioning protein